MTNKPTLLKRFLVVAAVVIGTLTTVSCLRDDDLDILRHPIHIEGSLSPNYALPVASGQMSFNDLLANLSSDFTGYIEANNEVLTVKWDGVYSDTIYPLSNYIAKSTPRPMPKDETYLYEKDTTISQSIPIPLFDNADLEQLANSSLAIKELWVNLTVAARGEPASVMEHITASYSEMLVTYVDRNGVTRQFDPLTSVTEVEVENLREGLHVEYDSINLASIVNSYPRQIDVSFRFNLKVKSSIQYIDWESYSFAQMLDTLRMARLIYSIGANVRVPFDINMGHFSYTYDLDLGDGTSDFNLDSIVGKIHDSLHVNVDSLKLMLDFYNHIPVDLKVDAQMLDADGHTQTHLFDNQTIRAGKLHEMHPPYRGSYRAYDTTHTRVPAMLTNHDVENIKQWRTLRLKVGLYSNDQFVVIRREDYLRIRASLQAAVAANFNIPVTENGLIK